MYCKDCDKKHLCANYINKPNTTVGCNFPFPEGSPEHIARKIKNLLESSSSAINMDIWKFKSMVDDELDKLLD